MRGDRKAIFSVVIPAYKQEKTITQDLRQIKRVLEKIRYDFEVVVVVDGKVDGTYSNARRVKSSKIRVVGYPRNRGKGFAVRYGMARTRGDIVGFIDAGMDLNPNGLSMLLEHFEWYDADVMVGSKRHPASKVPYYPLLRKIYSFGYHFLTSLLFGLRLSDTQAGLKIFKRGVLEDVLPRLLVKTHAFDIEMLSVARHLGYKRIFEAPVEVNIDQFRNSSNIKFKTARDMLRDTLAVFYRLRIRHYYDDPKNWKWKYDPELNFKVNVG